MSTPEQPAPGTTPEPGHDSTAQTSYPQTHEPHARVQPQAYPPAQQHQQNQPAPAVARSSGSGALALVGAILMGVTLVANIFTPLVVPMMMRNGQLDNSVISVVYFAISIGYTLVYIAALICGIVALRSGNRRVLAAMVVGAAAFSLASVLVGYLSTALMPLVYGS